MERNVAITKGMPVSQRAATHGVNSSHPVSKVQAPSHPVSIIIATAIICALAYSGKDGAQTNFDYPQTSNTIAN